VLWGRRPPGFDAGFRRRAPGRAQVCGGPALSLARYEELELLVCGLPHLDFEGLERAARYEGGYGRKSPAVVALWSVVHALSIDQKRRFLFFTTGCDRRGVVVVETNGMPLVLFGMRHRTFCPYLATMNRILRDPCITNQVPVVQVSRVQCAHFHVGQMPALLAVRGLSMTVSAGLARSITSKV
jgi:HECT-domain (ubiquitin-transferase)